MDLLGRGRARAEFDTFVSTHVDSLMRTAFLITGSENEAEDLVQECLLRLARRWPRVRSMAYQGAYARRVLANLALDGARRRSLRLSELAREQRSPEELAHGAIAAQDAGALELRAELIEALATLPRRQRTMLVLRYFEDLTEAQVARMLGCSLGTVKSTTSRALARLRATLERDAEPTGAETLNHKARAAGGDGCDE